MRTRNYQFLLFTLFLNTCPLPSAFAQKAETAKVLTDPSHRQFDYYFYEGLRLKEAQKYDQALETFRLCLAIDSLDAGALSEMGMLYASIGLKNDAVNYFEKAVQQQPTNWWYNVRLITLQSDLNQLPKAIVVANNLQKIYPNKEEVYNILTALYKETRQYDKAINAYNKLESLTGINEAISVEKFQLYILSNKKKKAIAEIDKLINKYPTETRYKVVRGDIFMQQKMPEMAFSIYQKVVAEDPQNAYVYVSLSEYYKAINEPEKALESIVSALKNEQVDVDTKIEILGQYVEKMTLDSTKLGETERLFKLLVDRYPLEEQVHGYYAVFLQYQKRIPETISELETMININPKNEQTWMRLIQLYIPEKNFQPLLTVTGRAIENLPKVAMWYFYRGIAQFQMGDYRASLGTYETALPLITEEQGALKENFYAQIADVHYKLGEKEAAFAAYEKVLVMNPKNIMAMNNYAYYLSLEKIELKKAERMSAKTVEMEPKNSTYLDTYAWILYQQGSYSLAKFYIEKAVDNLPKEEEHGVVLEHYGDILWMSGKENESKALEIWQKAYDAGNKSEALKEKISKKGWKKEELK